MYTTPYFVFDAAVPGLTSLLSGLPEDARVLVLSAQHDGLMQIADALDGERDLAALHVISHGSDGALYLGNTVVTEDSLCGSAAALARIGAALGEDADILLYGCNVAASETGESFIAAVADSTGANVAASRNLTGAGGDWELQATVGSVVTQIAISADVRQSYPHALGVFTFNDTSIVGNALTTTVDGVTLTVTAGGGYEPTAVDGYVTAGEVNWYIYLTFRFSVPVDISRFYFDQILERDSYHDYDFFPDSGSILQIEDREANNRSLTPHNWTGVSSFSVSYDHDSWNALIDDIEFTISNALPVLTGTPADDIVTEDVAAAIDLSDYTLSDDDGDDITLTLAVDRGTIASTDGNGVTSGVTVANSGTASMTLQGTAADLNTYLGDASVIEFTTASDDTTTATLTVTPNDGIADGTADTISISVTGVNDSPALTVSAPSDVTVNEDQSSNIDLSALTFGDVDSASVTVILSVDIGSFGTPADGSGIGGGVTETLVNATEILLVGAPADIDTYLNTASNISYTGPAETHGDNTATLIIRANDGDGSGVVGLATMNIDITPVNDAPVLANVFGDSSTVISAAAGAQDVTDLNDAALSNVDSADYSGGSLTLAQATGTMNGSWGVDGTTVTSGGDAIISAGETIQVSGATVGTVKVTEDGQGGSDLTIEFTTTDATNAAVEDLLQSLTYAAASAPGVRGFNLTLNDGDGTANDGDADVVDSFDLRVTSVAPVIAHLDGDSLTFKEGDSATLIDVGGDLTVTDDDSTFFENGTLTISYESGMLAEDRITIDTSGGILLSNGLSHGSAITLGQTVIGFVAANNTGGAGEDLVIDLHEFATASDVQELLRAIQYDNVAEGSPTDGDRVLGVTLEEADGATSALASVTINVDPTPAPTPTPTPTPPVEEPIKRLVGQSDGNDSLAGAGGNDTLGAGDGDDNVQGQGGDDIIYGNSGADTISGGNGDDQLFGGEDNDFISGGAGDDTIFGGTGNNGAFGGAGNDTVISGGGNDRLGGGADNDSIRAGAGDDTLFGGAGDDREAGGTGDDMVFGGSGNDRGFGDAGDDSLFGGSGNDAIGGGSGNDALNGELGDDTLYGGDGEDALVGGAGADTLYGGAGADTLNGGSEDDLLFGGAGRDTFIFASAGGADEIKDFDAALDRLDLTDFGFDDLADALASAAQNGDDLVFTLGGGDSLVLHDVDLAELTATNVLF